MNKAISEWFSKESELFTILTGERFTRSEVAWCVVYVVGLIACLGIVGPN